MNITSTQTISFDDFTKLELKVGSVLEAEEVAGSEKLIKLKVDLGEESPRQILAGVKQWYSPEDLVGSQVVVVANLEPRMMMGLESQGMLLAADGEEGPVFLTIPKQVPPGSGIG
jgi:methionyl-tRNA synthetase